MARKLYIFVPTGRVKTSGNSAKWIGGFVTTHAFLGDQDARLLGMGLQYALKRPPAWLHTPATGGARNLKGGASRHDRDFGGWG